MAFVNYATREVNAKIVYYGPGLSGKTTNIENVFNKVKHKNKGKLISLSTQGDRTLFFDFLPVELGNIKGFKTRFHLYTVPGQVFYNSTRKLVLKGADGVVFVADSQDAKKEENMRSFQNLKQNLADMGVKPDGIPIVVQYNKRDLPNVTPVEEIDRYLNPAGLPYFEASAINGEGVLKTLTAIVKLIMHDLKRAPSGHQIDLDALEGAMAKAEESVPAAAQPKVEKAGTVLSDADIALFSRLTAPEEPPAVKAPQRVEPKPRPVARQTITLPIRISTSDGPKEASLRISVEVEFTGPGAGFISKVDVLKSKIQA